MSDRSLALILAGAVSAVAMLPGLPAPAHAATAYRCEVNGVVVYSDQPCGSKQKTVDADPGNPTDADRAEALRRAQQEKAEARQMQSERELRQRAEDIDLKKSQAAATKYRQGCNRLALRIKRAEDDFNHAQSKNYDQRQRALTKARDEYQLECARH